MLQRTKSKRMHQFHERYDMLCNAWFNETMRECGIKPYTEESHALKRLFNIYQSEVFTEALKMLSP